MTVSAFTDHNAKSEVLKVGGLSKSFGANRILKDISFSVFDKELVFVVGPSGSGKSTLLRCLNRLEEPDAGAVIVDGIDLSSPKTDINRMRQKIGMVFQSFNLYPHMSALANITLALKKVQKLDTSKAESLAAVALDRVGLRGKEKSYPSELSGGQQQRVAIARAIALEPKVMLFDEPTSALDPALVGSVLNVMRDLRNLGMTMIVVSHEMRFAREAADRIIFMQEGSIIEAGTPDYMFSSRANGVTKAFLGRAGV